MPSAQQDPRSAVVASQLSENFILNNFISWYTKTVSLINKDEIKTEKQFRNWLEQNLKKTKYLFPNILKTAYKKIDESIDNTQSNYKSTLSEYYIFDLNYLIKNKPSKQVRSLSSAP